MSKQDQLKWDKKFSTKSELLKPREASANLKEFINKAVGKKALDLACGAGRNTLFLARNGFNVDAVDISVVVLEALSKYLEKENLLESVKLNHTDLDDFTPYKNSYDFIVMTNFLDRELIQRAKSGLRKDGIFLIETYMDDPSNQKRWSEPDFLLKKEELLTFFGEDFEVLLYKEFDNEPYEMFFMRKQAIVARKK